MRLILFVLLVVCSALAWWWWCTVNIVPLVSTSVKTVDILVLAPHDEQQQPMVPGQTVLVDCSYSTRGRGVYYVDSLGHRILINLARPGERFRVLSGTYSGLTHLIVENTTAPPAQLWLSSPLNEPLMVTPHSIHTIILAYSAADYSLSVQSTDGDSFALMVVAAGPIHVNGVAVVSGQAHVFPAKHLSADKTHLSPLSSSSFSPSSSSLAAESSTLGAT